LKLKPAYPDLEFLEIHLRVLLKKSEIFEVFDVAVDFWKK
jgi:hypothetical protein